jgi:hypothetical protein
MHQFSYHERLHISGYAWLLPADTSQTTNAIRQAVSDSCQLLTKRWQVVDGNRA